MSKWTKFDNTINAMAGIGFFTAEAIGKHRSILDRLHQAGKVRQLTSTIGSETIHFFNKNEVLEAVAAEELASSPTTNEWRVEAELRKEFPYITHGQVQNWKTSGKISFLVPSDGTRGVLLDASRFRELARPKTPKANPQQGQVLIDGKLYTSVAGKQSAGQSSTSSRPEKKVTQPVHVDTIPPHLIDLAAAATRFGIPASTLSGYCKRGAIPAQMLYVNNIDLRRWYIDPDSPAVVQYLAGHKQRVIETELFFRRRS